jgi:hypothetical protein
VDLSCHYIGQHVVKNYFLNARRLQRERIVLALVGPSVTPEMGDRLRRCKEGQGVLRHTHAELWTRNPAEWKAQMNKHDQGLALLRDLNILPTSDPAPLHATAKEEKSQHVLPPHVPTAQVTDTPNALAPCADGKKKRKRKRGGKAKQQGSADAESNDEISENEAESDLRPSKKGSGTDVPIVKTETSAPAVSEPKLKTAAASDRSTITPPTTVTSRDRKPEESEPRKQHVGHRGGYSDGRRASPSEWSRPQREPAAPSSSLAAPSKRADMSFVRSLQNGKMMSKSMLNDAIIRLESEKKKQ